MASLLNGGFGTLEAGAPTPPLESREPGGPLRWEAGLLEKARAWARNPDHACDHALLRF